MPGLTDEQQRDLRDLEDWLLRGARGQARHLPSMGEGKAWATALDRLLAHYRHLLAVVEVEVQRRHKAENDVRTGAALADEADRELATALARVSHLEQQLRAAVADRDHQARRAVAAEARAGHVTTLLDKRDREQASLAFAGVVDAGQREARRWRHLFRAR